MQVGSSRAKRPVSKPVVICATMLPTTYALRTAQPACIGIYTKVARIVKGAALSTLFIITATG